LNIETMSFRVEDGRAAGEITAKLEHRFRVRHAARRAETTCYDTFDGRLHADGGSLLACRHGDGWQLSWATTGGAIRHRLHAPELLVPVIETRRLLPVVRIRESADENRILDADDKTIALVCLVRAVAYPPTRGGRGRRLPMALRVTRVKGYDAAFDEVVAFVASELTLDHDGSTPFAHACAAIGVDPAGTPSKLDVALEPGMRADAATTRIYRTLLDTILANEAGTIADLDTEFLHDLRVAVRRTRTGLGQLEGVFSIDAVEPFREGFSWLGDLTGATRDLDVHVLATTRDLAELPESERPDLLPLLEILREEQRLEQRRLAEGLASGRYRTLVASWRRFLERAPSGATAGPDAARPVRCYASERIERCFRKVVKRGDALGGTASTPELHQLRIACKKLRYLLEFFSSLYDSDGLAFVMKRLKRLQNVLGDLNDIAVQRRTLARVAARMLERGVPSAGPLLAIGCRIERLHQKHRVESALFAERFAELSSSGTHQRFKQLLEAVPTPKCQGTSAQPIALAAPSVDENTIPGGTT
jgi:CHAD domain-containing protein